MLFNLNDCRVRLLDPFTPQSEKHLISPYNIFPKSNIKIMKKKGNDQTNFTCISL